MGCDIHSFLEKKVDGKWKNIPEQEDKIDRHYDLFSILADVRNGYGFAGVKTGEGFNFISEPKGSPIGVGNSADKPYWKKSEMMGCDGHSHSWLTLKEIKDFDWGQITMKRGVISLEEYKALKETGGRPESWSRGISGMNIITVDENEADDILSGKITIDKRVYVSYHWSQSYSDICDYFLKYVNEVYSQYGLDEDVRLVFFFDN